MAEWLLAFLIMVNAIILVPMLIRIHAENLMLRKLIAERNAQLTAAHQR